MSMVAIHLNDARIATIAASGEQGVYAEPGFALLGDHGITTGIAAFAESRRHPRSVKNRYLFNLNLQPLGDKRFQQYTPADLAAQQLEQLWGAAGAAADGAIFVVPGFFDSTSLGVLLGIADELRIPVSGIVDSAVAATRREYPARQLVNIELGLHATIVSQIDQQDAASLRRSDVVADAGLEAMRSSWLQSIAEAFVVQSRFDPLHTADTEQLMLDRLASWLQDGLRKPVVEMLLEFQGVTHTAKMESLQLIDAVSSHYQAIANSIRAMTAAGSGVALQFAHDAADLPGFTEFVGARTGGETFVLEPDAAARGALARQQEIAAGGRQRHCRELSWDQGGVAAPVRESSDGKQTPTHVLHDDIALTINGESLVIGSDVSGDSQRISLSPGTPGVSQRHCSVQLEGARCILSDHSRYGTFLNGNRISGSTVLQVGDVIRVGTPGIEFRMIRVVDANAA